MKKSNYLVQPSVIRLISLQPKLRVYYRDRRAQFIYTATSEDDGSTWTTPIATSLPNNNAGIHAIRLQSGAVVLIYNNMSGETKGDLRNILTISLSDDYGETFPFTRVLEHHNPSTTITDESRRFGGLGPTACDCYSYPTAIQSEDGFIHIAFTCQRRTIKYLAQTPQRKRHQPDDTYINHTHPLKPPVPHQPPVSDTKRRQEPPPST